MNIKNKIKYRIKRIYRTINSICLCIRFPFLYPRNRFTGLHYNNWKINDKLKQLVKEAYTFGGHENGYKSIVKNRWKWIQYKVLKWFHDWFLQIIFCIPTYTELDAMPEGWRKSFGIQMCKEIKKALLYDGGLKLLYNYRISQIKEKYGELCWYDCGSTQEIFKIIAKYEYISRRTCIVCGKTADGLSRGWISPYCKNCAGGRELDEYYTEELPFYDYYNNDSDSSTNTSE